MGDMYYKTSKHDGIHYGEEYEARFITTRDRIYLGNSPSGDRPEAGITFQAAPKVIECDKDSAELS